MANKCAVLVLATFAALMVGAACSLVLSSGKADLNPNLTFQDTSGGPVAFEAGQPVPTFDRQPRPTIDLDGQWRFEAQDLQTRLSLTNRRSSLSGITAELGNRGSAEYDVTQWPGVQVPGSFNIPPDRTTSGGFYRTEFFVPPTWAEKFAALKFGSVRYVADVWLNGHYLGYHEGGDTPFALDATPALIPGAFNNLVVRVDNPVWGTRDDIVPWGLADWWNYGGIVGDVWMEAMPALAAVRADVKPHLDGADLSIVLQHRGVGSVKAALDVRLWPAQVTAANLLNPDASSLIPSDALPILVDHIDAGTINGDSVSRIDAPFAMRSADLWRPALPALYVLQVSTVADDSVVDNLYTSFGLRSIKVDTTAPRLLLNGDPVVFNGVALHEELEPAGGIVASPADIAAQLRRALAVHADLIRVDHHPPDQLMPLLADRLGIALWEEIPLYHYSPQTFSIAMDRGVPQQMLAEMDLRDFNRPSVLFHGFANESTGDAERMSALRTLRNLDRRIDGTRLTGQAMLGTNPADSSSADLDVAGYTFYYGVLYGGRLSGAQILSALMQAHRTYPRKPIMVLEYGHWADTARDEATQVRVFNAYYAQMSANFDTEQNGFVGAALWWSLDDYWTQKPGITIERFGLYRPDGTLRPVGAAATRAFALNAPPTSPPTVRSKGVAVPITATQRHALLLPYIVYGLALPAFVLALVIVALSRVRRQPAW